MGKSVYKHTGIFTALVGNTSQLETGMGSDADSVPCPLHTLSRAVLTQPCELDARFVPFEQRWHG